MQKELTVTFSLNEPQWDSLQKMSKIGIAAHYCDLNIRANGRDNRFEVDFLHALFREANKNMRKP